MFIDNQKEDNKLMGKILEPLKATENLYLCLESLEKYIKSNLWDVSRILFFFQ